MSALTVYKVVRASPRRSGLYDSYGYYYPLHYEIGRVTAAPEGTGLLVFETLRYARWFMLSARNISTCTILVCDANTDDTVELPPAPVFSAPWADRTLPTHLMHHEMRSVWAMRDKRFPVPGISFYPRWPDGTRAYSRLVPRNIITTTTDSCSTPTM